jgi:hypothetical protein
MIPYKVTSEGSVLGRPQSHPQEVLLSLLAVAIWQVYVKY